MSVASLVKVVDQSSLVVMKVSSSNVPSTVANNYLFDGDPLTSESIPASYVVVIDLGDNEYPFNEVKLIFSTADPSEHPGVATSSVLSKFVSGAANKRLKKVENITEVPGMSIPSNARAMRIWMSNPSTERYLKIFMASGNTFSVNEVLIDFKPKSE